MSENDGTVSFGRVLFLIAATLAVLMPLRWWVAEPISVASPSMEPTLHVGTYLLLDKLTLRSRAPRRGDIVVLRSPDEPGVDLIKRIVALSGESLELRQKRVYIDGRELDEPYAVHSRQGERLEGDDLEARTVPAGNLFVLGDNRDESRDSSVWKDPATGEPRPFVPQANVLGLVRGIY
ncbi:MAG: signal peptidase I [Elusimicrobia bacterium]|nr:signal peptidase I [Elusimicrobiota bacterium]